jgi:hypothetical protein
MKRAAAYHSKGQEWCTAAPQVTTSTRNLGSSHPRWVILGGHSSELGGHSSEASSICWSDCNLSAYCRAIKPCRVVVLWSLLTFARKMVCHH